MVRRQFPLARKARGSSCVTERLSIETARQLLDFTGGDTHGIISAANAEQQLAGAVAVHNLLASNNVAYLADEVGDGQDLRRARCSGVVSPFRSDFSCARYCAAREHPGQVDEGMAEFRKTNHHSRRPPHESARRHAITLFGQGHESDLTSPARSAGITTAIFFVRLTSFSVSTTATELGAEKPKTELKKILPWLDSNLFNQRNKEEYRRNLGRAINCALPDFDLVIVDEAHNLKAGWSSVRGSARNAVLGCALRCERFRAC